MPTASRPLLGLAVSTIGRPALAQLLQSAAESSLPPAAVAIANQSGDRLDIDLGAYPFPVTCFPSSGGVSAGRNAALAALPEQVRLVGFPNDDSYYPPAALESVVNRFSRVDPPDAVTCSSDGRIQARGLPPQGTPLDRSTVWSAVEPGLFFRRASFAAQGGFRIDLGTGCPSPWQSGEGTDLLLRIMASGGRVESAADIAVLGAGERRDLSDDDFVLKLRRYARGTGYVYRIHSYPLRSRLMLLAAPWVRMLALETASPLAMRIAFARSVGRLEGLLERPLREPHGQPERQLPPAGRENTSSEGASARDVDAEPPGDV